MCGMELLIHYQTLTVQSNHIKKEKDTIQMELIILVKFTLLPIDACMRQ